MRLKVNNNIIIGDGPHVLYPGIFASRTTGSWDNYISFKKLSGENPRIQLEDNSGHNTYSQTFEYTSGEWMHLAISMDERGVPWFYVNGTAKGHVSGIGDVYLKYLGLGYAGSKYDGSSPGVIGELKLFAHTLGIDDVIKDMNNLHKNSEQDVETELNYQDEKYILSQNYPNPFNKLTTIAFRLPEYDKVTITIYDINGEIVNNLVSGYYDKGIYEIEFTGDNLAPGTYIYTFKSSQYCKTKKMVVIK